MVVSNWVSSGDTLMKSTQLHIQGFLTVRQKEVLDCSYWSGDYNRATSVTDTWWESMTALNKLAHQARKAGLHSAMVGENGRF